MAPRNRPITSLQQLARRIMNTTRQRENELTQLLRARSGADPQIVKEDVAAFRRAQRDELTKLVTAGRDELAAYRAAAVHVAIPDPRPGSTAEAVWLNAKAALAQSWSPATLAAELKQATERGDVAAAALFVPLAESVGQWRKGYMTGELSNAIVDGRLMLDSRPEVVAIKENAEWADTMDAHLTTLETLATSRNPVEQFDTYMATGAFGELLPQTPFPETSEAK